MKIQNNQFLSIEQLQEQYLKQTEKTRRTQNTVNEGISFQEILNQKTLKPEMNSEVKFSKHAVNRLAERKIELTESQLDRLNEGTQKAGVKGIHDSLIMIDRLAFIVNVPNNTVITAMDQTETKDIVFTNIDGAVIM